MNSSNNLLGVHIVIKVNQLPSNCFAFLNYTQSIHGAYRTRGTREKSFSRKISLKRNQRSTQIRIEYAPVALFYSINSRKSINFLSHFTDDVDSLSTNTHTNAVQSVPNSG